MRTFAEKYHRPLEGISPSAESLLTGQYWNGNIRELQNQIEKAVILSEGTSLRLEDFDRHTEPYCHPERSEGSWRGEGSNPDEETLVKEAVRRAGGNISAAAKALGISRPTLYAKLKKYGL